jgi:hypothetical protein
MRKGEGLGSRKGDVGSEQRMWNMLKMWWNRRSICVVVQGVSELVSVTAIEVIFLSSTC